MWQTALQEAGRIWLVSSWMMALAFAFWIKASSELKLSKRRSLLILISMSTTHAALKAIVPEIAFIFILLMLIMVSVVSYKQTIFKAFKSIANLFVVMFVAEMFLHILVFKVLDIKANYNDDIFWVISSALTLLLVIAIKRKELLKDGHTLLGRASSKHKETRKA